MKKEKDFLERITTDYGHGISAIDTVFDNGFIVKLNFAGSLIGYYSPNKPLLDALEVYPNRRYSTLAENLLLASYLQRIGEMIKAERESRTSLELFDSKDAAYKVLAKEAKKSRKQVRALAAELEAYLTLATAPFTGPERTAWCSACLSRTKHTKLKTILFTKSTFICSNCHAITTSCAAPKCDNMARRPLNTLGSDKALPPVCAEHSREIYAFDKRHLRITDPQQWRSIARYRHKIFYKTARKHALSLGFRLLVSSQSKNFSDSLATFLGRLGTGLKGIAALNHGYALLGGGPKASGGGGMQRGRFLANFAAHAFTQFSAARVEKLLTDDPHFDITLVRPATSDSIDNTTCPIVFYSSGFLTQNSINSNDWLRLINTRFPHSAVYRIHWSSEDLLAIQKIASQAGGPLLRGIVAQSIKAASTKAAQVASAAGIMTAALDRLDNPWSNATRRASEAGRSLANILQFIDHQDGFVLVGHSLGARLMGAALTELKETNSTVVVQEAHLLGGAFKASTPGADLTTSTPPHVFNYYSANDTVLQFLFTAKELSPAAGFTGLKEPGLVRNIDVTDSVANHSAYLRHVSLANIPNGEGPEEFSSS